MKGWMYVDAVVVCLICGEARSKPMHPIPSITISMSCKFCSVKFIRFSRCIELKTESQK